MSGNFCNSLKQTIWQSYPHYVLIGQVCGGMVYASLSSILFSFTAQLLLSVFLCVSQSVSVQRSQFAWFMAFGLHIRHAKDTELLEAVWCSQDEAMPAGFTTQKNHFGFACLYFDRRQLGEDRKWGERNLDEEWHVTRVPWMWTGDSLLSVLKAPRPQGYPFVPQVWVWLFTTRTNTFCFRCGWKTWSSIVSCMI